MVVEQGESCLYVKVNCKDRRGLLGDIIMALKAMPLEVDKQENAVHMLAAINCTVGLLHSLAVIHLSEPTCLSNLYNSKQLHSHIDRDTVAAVACISVILMHIQD